MNRTIAFYILIGIASSLSFFLVLYWALRLNSAITNIVINTYGNPLYFWPYMLLTLGTIVLFGVNIALLVYRVRKYGFPKISYQAGAGMSSLIGIAASSCPVCGSIILSAVGIAGGLAVFPFQGLELKALSFGFMALPIFLTRRELKRFDCGDETCPAPHDHTLKKNEKSLLIALFILVFALLSLSWNMLKSEPLIQRALATVIF